MQLIMPAPNTGRVGVAGRNASEKRESDSGESAAAG